MNNCVQTFDESVNSALGQSENFSLPHEMKTHLAKKTNNNRSEVVSQENFTLLTPNATVNSAKSNRLSKLYAYTPSTQNTLHGDFQIH